MPSLSSQGIPWESLGVPWESVSAHSQGIPWESLGVPWELIFVAVGCCFSKGEAIMTLFPLTDCCLLLGVDPKTLRQWLASAHLSCSVHLTDARLKCLTPSQLHHLATLHDRFLPDPLPGEASERSSSTVVRSPFAPATSPQERAAPEEAAPPPEADWHQQLALLQDRVATLQEQVIQLALALVQQQHVHPDGRGAVAASPLASPVAPAPKAPAAPVVHDHPVPPTSAQANQPHRTRALPLLEERTDGQVVVISPTQGVLPLIPDSPEWFDWLSSLTAFAFQSQHGRFSATRKFRDGHRIQSWTVHRSLNGRSCSLYLGLTPTLTLARLQEMTTAVQARLT